MSCCCLIFATNLSPKWGLMKSPLDGMTWYRNEGLSVLHSCAWSTDDGRTLCATFLLKLCNIYGIFNEFKYLERIWKWENLLQLK